MPQLSYEARTEYPTADDVERISHEVIREVLAVTVNPNPLMSCVIAEEIRRRLCELIRVEVDLTITDKAEAATGGSGTPCFTHLPEWLRPPHFFGSFPGPR